MTVDLQEFGSRLPVADRDRFAELTLSPHFDVVISANRLYLTAAVADALATEGRQWVLTCLPTTAGSSRFSTISMSGMETFVLYKPDGAESAPTAMIIVSERTLTSFGRDFDADDLEISPADYRDGGDDQIRVVGEWHVLARALAAPPLRVAARELTQRLLQSGTSYSRYHSADLADRVLGRS